MSIQLDLPALLINLSNTHKRSNTLVYSPHLVPKMHFRCISHVRWYNTDKQTHVKGKIMITREQCKFFESPLLRCCQTWEEKHWKPQCASNISPDSRAKIHIFPDYYLIFPTKCFPIYTDICIYVYIKSERAR